MSDYTIEWNGVKVKLKEDDAFLLADAVENHVTFGELVLMRQDLSRIPFAQLANAYASLLNACGIQANAKDIRKEFVTAMRKAEKGGKLAPALEAIDWLILVVGDGMWELSDSSEGKEQKNESEPA